VITSASVVVIGSGAFGASLAYHLAATGERDVALLDRFAIASQTSPRAAGLTQQIRPTAGMTRLAMLAVEKIGRFAEETGEPMTYHRSGSVKMARTERDARQIRAELAAGQERGLEMRPLSADDLALLTPFARPDGVTAMWFTPSDLYLEPVQIPRGYANAAARIGVTVLPDTAVTGIRRNGDAVAGVTTNRGEISAAIVVDAAGAWAREVAAEAGIRVPIVPVRHQLMITEPIDGVAAEQPICRVIDANVYLRPEKGGLMLGGYETDPQPHDARRYLAEFQIKDLPLDLSVLRRLADAVRDQFPVFQGTAVREHRGGLPTMTADGTPIVGPVPGLRGFFAATGCCVGGLSISPAIGQSLAELILTGAPSLPLDELSITRFGPELADDEILRTASVATYAHQYSSGWEAAIAG
jgi:4-methylaminobutanoate oxidase (formaldehyde-forming)